MNGHTLDSPQMLCITKSQLLLNIIIAFTFISTIILFSFEWSNHENMLWGRRYRPTLFEGSSGPIVARKYQVLDPSPGATV